MIKYLLLVFVAGSLVACTGSSGSSGGPVVEVPSSDSVFVRNTEAREDSIKLALAYQLQAKVTNQVGPVAETAPVAEGSMEDAADDPAFWYNPIDPSSSVVFGTNKKGGIYAYSLDGEELSYYQVGEVNNIDIRSGIILGSQSVDLLGGSNRTDNSIVLFRILPEGKLVNVLENSWLIDTSIVDEVYGFSMYQDEQGKGYCLVNGKNGRIQQYRADAEDQQATLTLVRSWDLNTQPEGMVADDENQVLYAGEEERGIWRIRLEDDSQPELIPSSQAENNPNIAYDIEGLALYKGPSGDPEDGFLLASIQGSFTYAIFERTGSNEYLASFKVVGVDTVDGVEETDGLEIHSGPIDSRFPGGILILQDGFNYEGEVMTSQNFKLVDLREVLELVVSL